MMLTETALELLESKSGSEVLGRAGRSDARVGCGLEVQVLADTGEVGAAGWNTVSHNQN